MGNGNGGELNRRKTTGWGACVRALQPCSGWGVGGDDVVFSEGNGREMMDGPGWTLRTEISPLARVHPRAHRLLPSVTCL